MNRKRFGIALAVILLLGLVAGKVYAGTIAPNNIFGYDNIYGLTWANSTNVDATNYFQGGVALNDRLGGDFTGFALTANTLDTGQGANDLWDMNQNVQTTDNVLFNSVNSTTWTNGTDINAITEYYRGGENYTAYIEALIAAAPGGAPVVPSTFVIAADNSLDTTRADYICDGVADQVQINAAIAALPASGGKITLLEGDFNLSAQVTILVSNVTLEGSGWGTVIHPTAEGHGVHVGDGSTFIYNVHIRDIKFNQAEQLNNYYAIWFDAVAGGATCSGCSVVRCMFEGGNDIQNYGVRFRAGYDSEFLDNYFINTVGHNLRLRSSRMLNVRGNIQGPGCSQVLIHCGYVDESVIVGNIAQGGYRGILLDEDSNLNLVEGNRIIGTTANGLGIQAGVGSDYNTIIGNFISGQTGPGGAAISVLAGTGNRVMDNRLYDNDLNFADSGTDTQWNVQDMDILGGYDLIAVAGSPKGYRLNNSDCWVLAGVQLPRDLVEIVRIRVTAVALNLSGGQAMEVDLEANAAEADEPYNTEAVAVANKDSEETGYAANDIITWVFDSSDDADIADMTAKDSLEFLLLFTIASGDDNDTWCLIHSIQIEYV